MPVDDLCHGHQAHVLAEGCVGQHAEQGCKAGAQTIADNAAGKLRIGCLAVHTALYAGADITDRLNGCYDEHDRYRENCLHTEDWFYLSQFSKACNTRECEPGRIFYLLEIDNPGICIGNSASILKNRRSGMRQNHGHNNSYHVAD